MYHDATHDAHAKLETYLDSLVLGQGMAGLQLGNSSPGDEPAEAPRLVAAATAAEATTMDTRDGEDGDDWVTVSRK